MIKIFCIKPISSLIFLCLLAQSTFAVDRLALQLGTIAGEGWQLNNMILQIQAVSRQKVKLQLYIATLTVSYLKRPLEQLYLTCQQGHYTTERIACADGRLKIAGLFDTSEVKIDFSYHIKQQRLILNVKPVTLASGTLTLKIDFTPKEVQTTLKIQQMSIASFLEKLNPLITLPALPNLKGNLTTTLTFSGNLTRPKISVKGELTEFNFTNAESTQAGENITAQFTLEASQQQGSWQLKNSLILQQGEIYSDPMYVAITKEYSLKITTDMTWRKEQLVIHHFSYDHPQIIAFQGKATLQFVPHFKIITLLIELPPTELEAFYTHYLKSWLSTKTFGALNISGTLAGQLDWQAEQIYLKVILAGVQVEDTQKRFGLTGGRGILHWHNQATDLTSELHWSSAYVASKINLGESHLIGRLSGQQFELLQPWRQPILDGSIQIKKLLVRQIGQDQPQFELQGKITPISMLAVSNALNLPPLKGFISGQIPATHYDQQRLNIDGELVIQVFDGQVTVRALQIEEIFKQPILTAEVEVDKINLKTLTNLTEFGQIQGHLSGWIRQLRLVQWQPVSFDAYFTTPHDQTLPRKISQKAVNSLSSISGGGMVNALTRGFLNLFEEFSYQFIGIGCRLQNGVCELKGLEPVSGGYYIVKGSGLPRIDIIGYNQKINWNDLLTRLKAATRASHPIVK